jgi:hypothetical protein
MALSASSAIGCSAVLAMLMNINELELPGGGGQPLNAGALPASTGSMPVISKQACAVLLHEPAGG